MKTLRRAQDFIKARRNGTNSPEVIHTNIDEDIDISVCIDILGTIGESGMKLIRGIGELLRNNTGEKSSASLLMQRMRERSCSFRHDTGGREEVMRSSFHICVNLTVILYVIV